MQVIQIADTILDFKDKTNLPHAGRLLGAGCCSALEFLLNVRYNIGACPRAAVGRTWCGGRGSREDWHFKPLQSLMKFSLTWRKKRVKANLPFWCQNPDVLLLQSKAFNTDHLQIPKFCLIHF